MKTLYSIEPSTGVKFIVRLYDEMLEFGFIVYEVTKCRVTRPWSFVFNIDPNGEDDSVLEFMHALYGEDAFNNEMKFLELLWLLFFPDEAFDPDSFDIDLAREAKVYREPGCAIIQRIRHQLFKEEFDEIMLM